MEEREFELLGDVQDKHWLWLGRKKAMETLIKNHIAPCKGLKIADIGSGCGGNFEVLSQYGEVVGFEPSAKAIQIAQSKFPHIKMYRWKFPEKVNETFDLILASEVLEHIPNDYEAVEWLFDHLKPNGHVLITVPAHQYLWTQMDDVVHHQRRYSRAQLQKLFTKFRVVRLSYYNFLLYPLKILLVIYDRILKIARPNNQKQSFNQLPPPPINWVLSKISVFESLMLSRFSLPCGPSLILLAKKVSAD